MNYNFFSLKKCTICTRSHRFSHSLTSEDIIIPVDSVDCMWNHWDQWAAPDAPDGLYTNETCGRGFRKRKRTIIQEGKHSGKLCRENGEVDVQQEACGDWERKCFYPWSEWVSISSWGSPTKERTREKKGFYPYKETCDLIKLVKLGETRQTKRFSLG